MTHSPLVTPSHSKTVNLILIASAIATLFAFALGYIVASAMSKGGGDVAAFIQQKVEELAPSEVTSEEYQFRISFPGPTIPSSWEEAYEGVGEVRVAAWNSLDTATTSTAHLMLYDYPTGVSENGFDLESIMNGMADELGYRIKEVRALTVHEEEGLRYSFANQYSLAEGLIVSRGNRIYHLFFESMESDITAAETFFSSFQFTE